MSNDITFAPEDQKYNAPVIYMDSIKSIHKNYNIVWTSKSHSIIAKIIFFFFLNILEDTSPFMRPLIPLFWTSGDVCHQCQGICMLHHLHAMDSSDSSLEQDICWLLDGQYDSRAFLIHILLHIYTSNGRTNIHFPIITINEFIMSDYFRVSGCSDNHLQWWPKRK